MNLAQEYDRWHERVFAANPEHADEGSPWYKLVLEHLIPVVGKRVLEVGCGRGGFVHFLASQGASVCGTDFSGFALEVAAARAKREPAIANRIDLVQADAQQLPLANDTFDVIISCEMIEHLPDPVAAVREMARVCRPGGLLYLTTPNYLNFMGMYELYAAIRRGKNPSDFAQPLDRHYLFFQIRAWLCAAGWQIIDSDGTVHQVPIRGRDPVRLQFLERNRVIRRFLRPLALHYLLVGRKGGGPR